MRVNKESIQQPPGLSPDAASLPSLNLPKGGGAIRGIGEKFAANPATGSGSLTIPIYASPGRSGFGPQLAITYDSGAGNGPFGFGWNLSLPSVTRKTDKGLPRYADAQESDIFILSGAEDLVPALIDGKSGWVRDVVLNRTANDNTYQVHRYRPRVEGLFARIERWVNTGNSQDVFWRSISKDNVTTLYGNTAQSRIADPGDPTRIFTWLIAESYDDKGNVASYQYKRENSDNVDMTQANERNRTQSTRSARVYLKHVFYGNPTPYFPDWSAAAPVPLPTDWCFELVFDFGEHDLNVPLPTESQKWNRRLDPFSTYRSAFEIRTYRLCRRALMFHHFQNEPDVGLNCLVRSTDFTYSPAAPPADTTQAFYSFLSSVTQTAWRSSGAGYLTGPMPPVDFSYSAATIDETVRDLSADSLQNLPYGLDGSHYRWIDLNGEGASGILTEQAGSWFYKANLSPANAVPQFGPVEVVSRKPSLAKLSSGRQQLVDLSGDGQPDLVDFEGPNAGFYDRSANGKWERFEPFRSLPSVDWRDPDLKFIDLTGDGLPDVLITEDNAFCWHGSLGKEGFSAERRVPAAVDEERGPQLVFWDGTETIFMADMSGDGLTDLVRIRNGEVCYWPNVGYGSFGAKVSMDQAPWFDRPEMFDSRRIRLADIDGSGTVDIIYFAANAIHLYFNQSGNAWGTRRVLNHFPAVDRVSTATAVDLIGNGTACLVWSSPLAGAQRRPMRYIDLMGGQKPHLLVRFSNNLGAETFVQYAASTRFYVADKLAGTPWVTRLPFPVQVVEQVQTYDYISRNLFVSRYTYHHGYYDGVEREFRGFGRVDQFDTEELATLAISPNLPQPVNLSGASNVPPVCTKTWFHTGAFLGEDRISKYFEHEYYREGTASDESMLLDDTVLPASILLPDGSRVAYDLTGEEMREACRALRGSVLRQEIYAADGSDASSRPYSVSERNYIIEVLQPRRPNCFGVFFSHARESIDFHYERRLYPISGKNVADPRVTHVFTFAVDPFGNVLETAAVGYGRRYPDADLIPADQTKQSAILLTYTQNQFTNAVISDDAYRAPLTSQTGTFELLQVQPAANVPGVTNLFGFDELANAVQQAGDGAHDLPFEDLKPAGLTPGAPYRRLLGRTRSLYRPDDMGAAAGNAKALLGFGVLESLALPGITYKLALTSGLVTQTYQRNGAALLPVPANVLGSVAADGGGYVNLDSDGNWWIPSGREYYVSTPPATPAERNQAVQHFFLCRRFEDPFGNAATVDYDAYDLLATATTDAVNNAVAASNDYRVLAPATLTDPNGNRAAVAFDVRGFVAATATMGKATENLGDLLTGFAADLTQADIDGFYDAVDPHTVAAPLLGNASTRVVYDLNRFLNSRAAAPTDPTQWQAPFSATISRETHYYDLAPGAQSPMQITFSYSDGYGREIQKKIEAEAGPVVDGGPTVNLRWVGSGWTIFNNKGKPVRQYEPFFSQLPRGHQFEFAMQVGVSPIASYDPLGRIIATVNANQTYQKTVFDPWRQETWDVNDTVLITDPTTDPDAGDFFLRLAKADYSPTWYTQRIGGALGVQEQNAANKAAAHANTPAVMYMDSLGRTFLTILDNGAGGKFHARFELDISGNQIAIIDALDRTVVTVTYDVLKNRIAQSSMDSGQSWMLNAATGSAIRAWDSRGHNLRTAYDAMRRPVGLFVQGTDAANSDPRTLAAEVQYEKLVYGEGQPNDTVLNLRSRVFQHFDPSGLLTFMDANPATGGNEAYDFKGNLLRSQRTLVADYQALPNWAGPSPAFGPDVFRGSTQYDALNRPIAATGPDGSVVHPAYTPSNLLQAVSVNLRGAAAATQFVTNIDYNAKGQRASITYGNQASTTYSYDPAIFRLTRLLTTRTGFPADQQVVQDLNYTYDPAGNITHLQDNADIQNVIYFQNRRVEPSTDYTYDALYRLIQAIGREQLGLAGGTPQAPTPTSYNDVLRVNLPQPGDGNAMGTYNETSQYDGIGNLLQLAHAGSSPASPGWSRTYTYAESSLLEPGKVNNRLTKTVVSGTAPLNEPYTYDARGNTTSMIQLQAMQWDFKDELNMTQRQAVNAADQDGVLHQGERTYYIYDFNGERIRKVTQSAAGVKLKERFYLGTFEIYREYGAGGSISLERQTVHVMDDRQRIALIETKTVDSSAAAGAVPVPAIRYQYGNHLGSACLELDDAGAVISYEEYYPFGGTSYQAGRTLAEVSLKRYRYIGKERDEENGFNYNSARYYASWIGRWISPDPAGLVDGPNPYLYSRNNPIVLSDPGGKDPDNGAVNLGPFQFKHITLGGDFKLNASFTLNNLFSPDRSLTVNSLFAGGKLQFTADTSLFGLSGKSTAIVDLEQLSLTHGLFTADVSASATLSAGPLALDLKADALGTSILDQNISLSAPADSLRYTLDHFQGSANLSGRIFLRAGPINRVLGAVSVTADSEGESGALHLKGYVGLPTLDPGKNINIAKIAGEGTFGPGGYDIHGDFRLVLPPVAFATGRFDLNSETGLSASGHYFGIQVGPLGLSPSVDPFAAYRPPNLKATPDTVDTTMARQLTLPEIHPTGPPYAIPVFSAGTSVGYSYFRYSKSGYSILSFGISPSSSVSYTTADEPSLPFPLGSIPGVGSILYPHAIPSTSDGIYIGVMFTTTFWTHKMWFL